MLNQKTPPRVRLMSLALSVVQCVLLIGLVGVALLSFGARVPFLARMGFNFFAVTSGSMQPQLPVGSLVYAGSYVLEDLKVGDIITYQKTNTSNQPTIVTHRIFSLDKAENKQQVEENGKKTEKTTVVYTIKTKGDANNTPDEYTVSPGEIIGLYKWGIPSLGYVSMFAQSPVGFMAVVILPAVILIVWEIVALVMYFKSHYENKSKSEITRLKEELKEELTKRDAKHV